MNAIEFPFLHSATLIIAGVASWLAAGWLPDHPWRRAFAIAIGLAVAVLAGAFGLIPLTGTMHLAAHGLCMGLGAILGWWLAHRHRHLAGVDADQVRICVVLAMIAGVIGARARFVWERWESFAPPGRPWSEVLAKASDIDAGGAVWYGGVLFGALAVIAFALKERIRLLALADLLLPSILIGLAIGRLGCHFNGCCYGAPTDLPWAVACPVEPHHPVHPAPLYETAVATLLALGLFFWAPRRPAVGLITLVGTIAYAVWRFFNESLRDHGPLVEQSWLGLTLTTSQITSLQLVILALVTAGVVAWRRRRASNPGG